MTDDRDALTIPRAVDRLEAVVAQYDVTQGPIPQALLSRIEDIVNRLWTDAYDEGYDDAQARLSRRP